MINSKTPKDKFISVLTKGTLMIAAFAALGFVGLKLYPLVHGPKLDLATLSNGAVLNDPMIRLSGKALYTKDLIVNGNSLALATDGSFDEKIVLNPGYNFISIQAKDRFGKLQNHNYAIVLRPDPSQALSVRTPAPNTN